MLDNLPGGVGLFAIKAGGFMKQLKFVFILFAVLFVLTACQPKYILIPPALLNPSGNDSKGDWDAYFEEGNGLSSDTAYVISNIDDIASMRELIASGKTDFKGVYFKATNLDLTNNFSPIGTGELPFNGIFEGPSNEDRAEIQLTVNETEQEYIGLFGGLGENAEVRYINVSGSVKNDTPDGRAGMIAGILGNNAIIENCSATGSVEATMAGGLVGKVNAGGIIKDSVNNATVTGTEYAGGITGAINGNAKEPGEDAGIPSITNCYNYGNISVPDSSTTKMAGGIAGEARNAIIANCVNDETATITGAYQTGGIVGQTTGNAIIKGCTNKGTITSPEEATEPKSIGGISGGLGGKAIIENSINYGTINLPKAKEIGGIAGNANTGTIIDSYNEGNITGISEVGGIVGTISAGFYKITENFTPNTSNKGEIKGSASNIGGIIGSMSGNSSIDSSAPSKKIVNSGMIQGNGNTGGIVGYAQAGCTIDNTSNTGSITATGAANTNRAGGIVGNISNSTINSSNNSGDISGYYAGGIIGAITNESSINNTENAGKISGTYCGGILGCLWNVPSDFNSIKTTSSNITGTTKNGSVIGHVRGTPSITLINCYVDDILLSEENPITTERYIGLGSVTAKYTQE